MIKSIIKPIQWKTNEFGYAEIGGNYYICGNPEDGYVASFNDHRGVSESVLPINVASDEQKISCTVHFSDFEVVKNLCEEDYLKRVIAMFERVLVKEEFDRFFGN